ncbi:hypothetical protein CFOL_v3_34682 [Cephalotus follicularis]|uniref:Uncharacterized protein n=1 Tax=Cephalotus follicularis TaxID=3775 RepID=A0A1Q3DFT2_CEPFO|nr:hypothetical protein CFOL_v3_34682 [Cephalotus follicularis]
MAQQLQNLTLNGNPPPQNHHPQNQSPLNQPPPPFRGSQRGRAFHQIPIDVENSDEDMSDEDPRGRIRRRNKADDNDRGLHLDIPDFDGSLNPDDFVDWMNAIERLFDYKDYTEEKKFKFAILELKKYASLLWENVRNQRVREGKERIRTRTKIEETFEKKVLT